MSDLLNTTSGRGAYTEGIYERLTFLEHAHSKGGLIYDDVKNVADALNLTLAEYGDGADYSESDGYCYFNQSGDRKDPAAIYIEYNFDGEDEKFGEKNNSLHETYAVILEEFEEAQAEQRAFEINIRSFWNAVKANTATKCQLQQMRTIAEKAAAEWVQVAAMCEKGTK